MTEFVQLLVNGLGLGAIYALIAIGYSLVFGILRFINFAHGDVMMIGAYMGFYIAQLLGIDHTVGITGFFTVLILTMTGTAFVGFIIERLAYRPLRQAPRINALITAIGISLLLEFGGQALFGVDPKLFPELLGSVSPLQLGDIIINKLQLLVLILSALLLIFLNLIIYKTKYGLALRAVSHNHDWAALMGISINKVISITFMMGSALAGAAGVFIGITYPKIDPLMEGNFGV